MDLYNTVLTDKTLMVALRLDAHSEALLQMRKVAALS